MGQFSFQYPVWSIGLCLLAAFIAGSLLYYKSPQLTDRTYSQKLVLSFLRMTAVFLILLLLLNPLHKYYKQSIQKPVVIFAQDISESIIQKDSNAIRNFQLERDQFETKLKDKFDVFHLEFDHQCREQKTDQFNGKLTNINEALDHIGNSFDLQKTKAVIIASDGIQNTGKSPIYNELLKQLPVYPILLGDTTPEKDLWIGNLFFNEIVYAGDKFAIETDIQAWNLVSENSNLKLSKFSDGKWVQLNNESIAVTQAGYFNTKQFIVQTDAPGLFKFKISVDPIKGESNLRNNTREFYVDILDSKKKILILSYAPHPDISAIKDAISANKNYELTLKNISDNLPAFNDYSLVVFHQLPGPGGLGRNQIESARKLKIPSLLIFGPLTDINQFNTIQDIVTINTTNKTNSEATPIIKPSFTQFILSEQSLDYIKRLPPLNVPFGNYTLDPSASVLFYQKIGSIETNYPLLVLSDKAAYRSTYLLGEGLWKWKLSEYLNTNNFNFFTELVSKTIQYTSTKQDQRKFRISQSKRIFNEGENIPFYGELYNDNYERINQPDVNLSITSNEGLKFNFTFSRLENYYSLDIGSLAAGEYNYIAQTEWNRKQLTATGKFSIQAQNIETANRVADFNLLRSMALNSGGRAYLPSDLSLLQKEMQEDQKTKSILVQNLEINPLIDQKWYFFLIALCLILEWFFRRFWGSY